MPITDAEFVAMATRFNVKPGEHEGHPIYVEECQQRDNSVLYAIRQRGFCLNKQGDWEYEPIPSSRDDAFIARCRWADLEDAISAARACEP